MAKITSTVMSPEVTLEPKNRCLLSMDNPKSPQTEGRKNDVNYNEIKFLEIFGMHLFPLLVSHTVSNANLGNK